MLGPSFDYVQGRLQARHGDRLADSQWRRLAGSRLLGSYLQGIRRTPLEPWVRQLSEGSTQHVIELALRARWRQYVAALARWPSAGWGPAIAWVDRLVDLPVALELCRLNSIGTWAREDPVYGEWTGPDGGRAEAMTRHLGEAIVAACREGDPVAAWCREWRRLWPDTPAGLRAGLERLIGGLERHQQAMAGVTDAATGNALRAELDTRLNRLFRGYARTPLAIFAHLGLVALELERLRAALVERALYPAELGS